MRKKRFIIALGLIGQLLLTQACQYGNIQIEYVFPDGFRGPAVIRENQPDGMPSCETPWLPRTQVCTLTFPASGILHTQGDSPSQLWHRASAHYVNGTVIPVPYTDPGTTVSKDEIALWAFGSILHGEDWVFVGTEDEFRKFRDEKRRYK